MSDKNGVRKAINKSLEDQVDNRDIFDKIFDDQGTTIGLGAASAFAALGAGRAAKLLRKAKGEQKARLLSAIRGSSAVAFPGAAATGYLAARQRDGRGK